LIANFDATFDYSGNVTVLSGNGSGHFTFLENLEVSDGPVGIVTGDFNGDGKTDLAVTNRYRDNVSVLCGNGSGEFTTRQDFGVGSSPLNLIDGDFNGDGKTDLAVVNLGSSNVSVLLSGVEDLSPPTWSSGSLILTGLTLSWTGASDDVAVTGYRIYRDGNLLSTLGNVTTADISGLTDGTEYTFKVEAGDAAGNWSTDGPSTLAGGGGAVPQMTENIKPEGTGMTYTVKIPAGAIKDSAGNPLAGDYIFTFTTQGP
ncbi:MAG: FG-GAP-like repeat-containing protein, partial [Desulfocucumaceae bacterium]